MQSRTYLVLGGAGLVGTQVCRFIAEDLRPEKIVVAALAEREAQAACTSLRERHPNVNFVPEYGNLFVPYELASLTRSELLATQQRRRYLRDALYGDFHAAYEANCLVRMIKKHQPEIIVDAVNTATGISYQDVFDGAKRLIDGMDGGVADQDELAYDLELFLLSQSVPQIIRHVRFIYEATRAVGTRLYLKIGTTGTGGMGLNIPYTHSEDKPSQTLLAKTEVAFGHTGLLFLMSRTPDAPVVKEVKPAALIGYKAVEYAQIRDKSGQPVRRYEPRSMILDTNTELFQQESDEKYQKIGELKTTIVNTGENGNFSIGEFSAITAMGQMEFITPEEIARSVVLEIRGLNPGVDILGAIDSTVMGPSYRAGLLRGAAIRDLKALEAEMGDQSVALGQLGPPELSKLLFEAYLLRQVLDNNMANALEETDAVSGAPREVVPAELSHRVAAYARANPTIYTAVSIGIPVLMPDGQELLRGPKINIPELKGHARSVRQFGEKDIDQWAKKGWVDLRAENMARWQTRFRRMQTARQAVYAQGSAAVDRETYLGDGIEIGEVVAWIFNNEMGGSRLR
ncbi:MAG: hypothetical protein HUU55_08370 [Myxococcales bacterium]|nr:hypothetical protein [Myxococcales bacterium]